MENSILQQKPRLPVEKIILIRNNRYFPIENDFCCCEILYFFYQEPSFTVKRWFLSEQTEILHRKGIYFLLKTVFFVTQRPFYQGSLKRNLKVPWFYRKKDYFYKEKQRFYFENQVLSQCTYLFAITIYVVVKSASWVPAIIF